MEVIKAIRDRRSVRKYKSDPVDESTVNAVLEAAALAPSWANTQCWRFIVVRDPGVKSKLADVLRERRNPASDALNEAPVVIVACAERGRSGFYKGEQVTDKGDWFMFDVALAMNNLTLAAHDKGLGTVHIGVFDAPAVAALLEVPEDIAVVEMTPLGYPDQEPKAPPRKPLADLVFHEKYGLK